MIARVVPIENGKYAVYVDDTLIATKENEKDAEELKAALARPGSFFDNTDDNIDMTGPDGSAERPYPSKK